MEGTTRSQILKIIEKKGKIRPVELQEILGISRQAIHRHLRVLVEQGVLEVHGTMPLTQYGLAGKPILVGVSSWLNTESLTKSPQDSVCETRDVLGARLLNLRTFTKNGLPEALLPLVIATVGEIGNNSFDHNSGQWRDVPGCWFESQATGRRLWICVADRGQGVYQSLSKVHPEITNDQTALKAAFETIITGRAPEKRGNGLKFARNNISQSDGGLACVSGTGRVFYGNQGDACIELLNKHFTTVKGTVTLMAWRLQ